MALTITYVPGYVWTIGELVTEDKLNLSNNPTVNLEGSINSTSIADGSVTINKLADGVLTADAPGRAKMEDTYLVASKLGPDVAGDGLAGGDGDPLRANVDGITLETSGGKIRVKSSGSGGVSGASRNLVALNNTGAPNNKVDVTADEVLLKDSSNNPFLANAVSVTVDLTASGANGLDTGSEASSTWYYVFVIGKTDGTIAGLFSESSAAPTLPSGYVYKARVGAVRNDGSSNFFSFYQQDQEVFINEAVAFTAKAGVTSWTAISGTDLTAFQALVPRTAKQAWGNAGNTNNDGGIAIGSDANALGALLAIQGQHIAGPTLSFGIGGNWRVALKTTQTFSYIMANTSGGYRVTVSGFKL